MCGIVGYIGGRQAAPILLAGLARLEYRGYDSAGLAVQNAPGEISVVKAKGKLQALSDKTDDGCAVPGCCGIGHTRWATHGEPSENNAHPHISQDGSIVAVHNGIIENYQELRDKLTGHGYHFYSETDTEVAVNLIDYYLKKYHIGAQDALARCMVRIRGSYALAVLFKEYPDEIWVARNDSPLILGVREGEAFAASDIPAILHETRCVYTIDNRQIGRLTRNGVTLYDLNGDEVPSEPSEITWSAEVAEKGGWEHFMIKEIHEQPRAVRDTLSSVILDDEIDLSATGLSDDVLRSIGKVEIIACGSAYHAAMVGQSVIEELTDLEVRIDLASEFRYRNKHMKEDTLVVVISQSGETADSLAALREAKALGVRTLGIVNVVGSAIAREADHVFYTLAGPEIAVATTKAYSAQLAALYVIAIRMAFARGCIDDARKAELIQALKRLPDKIERALDCRERLQWFTTKFVNSHDIFLIGRGLDYAVSMEGSLKVKEVSYVHSEAYAAGELKHGTISLLEDRMLVIGILTQKKLFEKTLSNMAECKSRGAYLMGITTNGNYAIEDTVDFAVYVPHTDPLFAASLAVIPLQLMGYYLSLARGLDVDKPRNLAKSVTVE